MQTAGEVLVGEVWFGRLGLAVSLGEVEGEAGVAAVVVREAAVVGVA